VISEVNVLGDLIGLCKGDLAGRTSADEITMFKSVGTAIEDWAAAVLAYETIADRAT
jgi:alanine dehydrogenase